MSKINISSDNKNGLIIEQSLTVDVVIATKKLEKTIISLKRLSLIESCSYSTELISTHYVKNQEYRLVETSAEVLNTKDYFIKKSRSDNFIN